MVVLSYSSALTRVSYFASPGGPIRAARTPSRKINARRCNRRRAAWERRSICGGARHKVGRRCSTICGRRHITSKPADECPLLSASGICPTHLDPQSNNVAKEVLALKTARLRKSQLCSRHSSVPLVRTPETLSIILSAQSNSFRLSLLKSSNEATAVVHFSILRDHRRQTTLTILGT